MKIQIPFHSRKEDVIALKNAIERAAGAAGIDDYTATMFVSHFVEEIAEEVTHGRVVSIPGFGIFAPVLDERRVMTAYNRRHGPKPVPKFSPSKAFRAQVQASCPPSRETKRRYRKHLDNHARSTENMTSARVFTAQKAWRDRIAAQMADG